MYTAIPIFQAKVGNWALQLYRKPRYARATLFTLHRLPLQVYSEKKPLNFGPRFHTLKLELSMRQIWIIKSAESHDGDDF